MTFGDTTGKTEWAIRNSSWLRLARLVAQTLRPPEPPWRAMLVLLLRDATGVVPDVRPACAPQPERFHEVGVWGITREEELPLFLRGCR